ncbi:MAG: tetratricopeptide repeat protein [Nitrospiraceae bacterium]
METLTKLGYQPLDKTHPILTGTEATASAIMASVEEARRKRQTATIIVYYTGHGAVGATDLWLQTAGQKKVGAGQGLKVSDVIIQARRQDDGKSAFEGELVLILDACFSGSGIVSEGLTLANMGRRTTILTSSTDIQESFGLNQENLPQTSAFTDAVLQGLGPEWVESDSDHDGLLRWEELKLYATDRLRRLSEQGMLPKPMIASMLTNYSEGFIAYRRDQVRVWDSVYRAIFTTRAMNEILAAHLQTLEARSKEKPAIPKEAQRLAELLAPASEDYYTQAVKATAEGLIDKARTLFVKAVAQSQQRASQTQPSQQQAQAVQEEEKEKQGAIYLALARMEWYNGNFTAAFAWYQQAAKVTPPSTSELQNEIGVVGVYAGKYSEAEPYLQAALHHREQILGLSHPDVATTLNNLATLYHSQEKYVQAEPLYQRALQIDEVLLGRDHPDVARTLNNLAALYYAQGRYCEAEPLYQRALQITESTSGHDDGSVAISLNNLAELYRQQGKYSEAEPLYERAVRLMKKGFGAHHPNVAKVQNNLAQLLDAQAKYAAAEALYQTSFWILYDSLGPEHSSLTTVFNNYAASLAEQGQPNSKQVAWSRLQSVRQANSGTAVP